MKLNVAVFFGGETVEHEVSIISAHQALEALDRNKYEVTPVYIAKDRTMYTSELLWDMKSFINLNELKTKCTQVTLVQTEGKVLLQPVKQSLFSKKLSIPIDVAIPVMHGTNGEDGSIQGFFEMMKIPYTGCDVIAAGVGQDKVLQKHILHDNGLPITNWFWAYGTELDDDREGLLKKARKLIYPVILKPARTGSSVGISIAHNDEEYIECFEEARQYDEKVITEKVIKPMKEINCSVLGNSDEAKASVLEQVGHATDDELLSFRDKYQGGGKSSKSSGASEGMASTARIVPAPISEEETKLIQKYALQTFKVLGASGVCRIDFIMDSETKTVYVNEINTIPGSLAFYLWEASGMSFTQLMDELVRLALDRERKRSRMTFSYDTNLLETYNENSAKGSKGAKR